MPFELPHHVTLLQPGDDHKPEQERLVLNAVDMSQSFLCLGPSSNLQFSVTFSNRLRQLTPRLQELGRAAWPGLPEVVEDNDEESEWWFVGILFKNLVLRPSVIKKFEDALDVELGANFVGEEDSLIAETSAGRVLLKWSSVEQTKENIGGIVSGTIAAVRVRQHPKHCEVLELMLPGPPPLVDPSRNFGLPKLCLVSGLGLAANGDFDRLMLLKDWLMGYGTGGADVGRLVIVGNGLGRLPDDDDEIPVKLDRYCQGDLKQDAFDAIRDADRWLAEVSAAVAVDIIAGPDDPTTYAWPQLPIPPILFPNSRKHPGFRTLPCPALLDVGDVRCAFISNVATQDIRRYSTVNTEADALRIIVESNILAPTAPDTLASVPLRDKDVLVLPTPGVEPEVFPRVLVQGDSETFGFEQIGGCLSLRVPNFSKTGIVVLLDPNTLKITTAKLELRI